MESHQTSFSLTPPKALKACGGQEKGFETLLKSDAGNRCSADRLKLHNWQALQQIPKLELET